MLNKFLNKKTYYKNNKGFSLIELSIVLIILGLLVAGVTGGASLIKSANIQATITEIKKIDLAHITYYNTNGKVAGSVENNMVIGKRNSSCNCVTNSESMESTFFEDLKEEGLIDNEIFTTKDNSGSSKNGYKYIHSKLNERPKNGGNIVYSAFYDDREINYNNSYIDQHISKNSIEISSVTTEGEYNNNALSSYTASLLDTKIDDGKPMSGRLYSAVIKLDEYSEDKEDKKYWFRYVLGL